MPTRGKYLLNISTVRKTSVSHLFRTITKSSQSNGKNASRANLSGSDDPQANSSRSVPAPRASGTSAKIRTTSVNGVAVVRSGNMNPTSKKTTKNSRVIEISDQEDDDSLERDAALASPAKGAESRKATKVSKSLYICFNMYFKIS